MEHVDGYSGEPDPKPTDIRVELSSGIGTTWDFKVYLDEEMVACGSHSTFLKTAKYAQELLVELERAGKL